MSSVTEISPPFLFPAESPQDRKEIVAELSDASDVDDDFDEDDFDDEFDDDFEEEIEDEYESENDEFPDDAFGGNPAFGADEDIDDVEDVPDDSDDD